MNLLQALFLDMDIPASPTHSHHVDPQAQPQVPSAASNLQPSHIQLQTIQRQEAESVIDRIATLEATPGPSPNALFTEPTPSVASTTFFAQTTFPSLNHAGDTYGVDLSLSPLPMIPWASDDVTKGGLNLLEDEALLKYLGSLPEPQSMAGPSHSRSTTEPEFRDIFNSASTSQFQPDMPRSSGSSQTFAAINGYGQLEPVTDPAQLNQGLHIDPSTFATALHVEDHRDPRHERQLEFGEFGTSAAGTSSWQARSPAESDFPDYHPPNLRPDSGSNDNNCRGYPGAGM
ncbi:hypothetical protein BJ165DRAFT_1479106 [Panaeolus papilionaceus]|nr:hypothetical protein BJ165DRAFT_1479106 [Panaeolus papilionaceus]